MCCAAWYWNRNKKIVPTSDYQVPTKRRKYFNEKSKLTILMYIHMISYEYEYFGSARTPATKSSTRDHTASLFCFIQDRRIPRSLQRRVSMKSSISQLTFLYFITIAIEKPYTAARLLVHSRTNNELCLSLQQDPVGDSHNINNACVQQMVPETR